MKRLLVVFFLLVASPLFAANHYIRAGASGSNNGSSWANAWTTLGAVTWTRGDTYYLAGGTYSENVVINPGAGTSWVTIKKANASDNSGDAGWSATYASTVAQINGTFEFRSGYVISSVVIRVCH